MKVPFCLHRSPREHAAPAEALLLPSSDPASLLAVLSALHHDPLPPIHGVADGFLITPQQTIANVPTGVIALRRLAPNLYLPIDATLVPPLLDDEAAGLTCERGLVFLPGGPVLAFDPATPLPLSAVLSPGTVNRPNWRPFPPRPRMADRLREVLLDRPDDTAAAVIDSDEGVGGGPGAADAEPRAPDAGPVRTLGGQARLWAGQFLVSLGKALGWRGLLGYGASLAAGAMSRVPRLAESLLGRQEAALRDLLREFREGDPEKALRRALPVGGPGGRGTTPSPNDRLPQHNLDYSLDKLLGRGGVGSVWYGGVDVQQELVREYRRVALEAIQRGDHRRAAVIYARLLHDFKSAAATLERGGLFHDAALLYLEKVGDARAAAKAFASAGEIDRAVRLYRQVGEFAESGDLLKQAGEEDEALRDYRLAAAALAETPRGFLAAGELMLQRAGRPDVAREYFARGWSQRPEANAAACAWHLARLHADAGEAKPLLELVAEADGFYADWGTDTSASEFYNTVAKLAEAEPLRHARDELRDLALLGLAARLRQSVGRQGNVATVSTLLGVSGVWSDALVADARHAVLERVRRRDPAERRPGTPEWVRLAGSSVTAVCHCTMTGEVFAGLETGAVAWFWPGDGRVVLLPRQSGGAVAALTAAPDGAFVVAAVAGEDGTEELVHWPRLQVGLYDLTGVAGRVEVGGYWLTPTLGDAEGDGLFAACDGRALDLYGPGLRFWERLRLPLPAEELTAALLLPSGVTPAPPGGPVLTASASFPGEEPPSYALLLFSGNAVWGRTWLWSDFHETSLGWSPRAANGEIGPPLSWRMRDVNHVEVAGLRADGAACWSLLAFTGEGLCNQATHVSPETGYRAATLVRSGLVAAVGPERIDWLRAGGRGFTLWTSTWLSAPRCVACFVSHPTSELLVVCKDGQLVRVPLPG